MKTSMDGGVLVARLGDRCAFEMMKAAGFDAVDYSFYDLTGETADRVLGDAYLDHAKNVRAMLCEIGLECNQAHAPWGYRGDIDTPDITNDHFRALVRSMESASVMGAKCIVVHAISDHSGMDLEETNYRFYKSLEPYAEKFGIKIAVENLFARPYDQQRWRFAGLRFSRPESMMGILNRLGDKNFVCCIDVGHAAITDIEPQDLIGGIEPKYLCALHLHDNFYNDDHHLLPYSGRLNWDAIIAALKKANYQGDITLEVTGFTEKLPDTALESGVRVAADIAKSLKNKLKN